MSHERTFCLLSALGKAFVCRFSHLSATPTRCERRRISVTCWSAWAPRKDARLAPQNYWIHSQELRDFQGMWVLRWVVAWADEMGAGRLSTLSLSPSLSLSLSLSL
ncbi:hypothetical protein M5D96_002940 [Drosophila gunungcola]|uniref:Uncharacterized protein n=1 Tax=Drosophila gunungcola TaxID=103775 RepID=A0A9Q0BVZ2_9MUSC|nr:hypothetical protein M5D96_002940 [Drosophila gunungcola]